MSGQSILIRMESDPDLTAAWDAASASGVSIEHVTPPPTGGLQPQIEPITGVLIGAGAVAAAKFVLDWWERRKGGLVIDQRPGAPDMIHRTDRVPYGYVIIFPADGGAVKVEVKDAPKDAAERWVGEVISGAYRTVAELAKAADQALGDGRVGEEAVTA